MKFFLSMCAALVLLASTSVSAEPQAVELIVSASSIVKAVNDARVANGATPLCLNDKLAAASMAHAVDMATNNFIGGVGSTGSTATIRAQAKNFNTTGVEELTGMGYENAAHAVKEWMSATAYSQYLLGKYAFIGAGFASKGQQTYYVLDFAKDGEGEKCA